MPTRPFLFRLACVIAVVASAGLAACGTAPPRADGTAAGLPAPGTYKTAGPPGEPALAPRWWQLFDDAQLDALQQRALDHSPTLAAALARSERVRALLAGVRADEMPRIAGEGQAQRLRTSSEVATAPVVAGHRVAVQASQFAIQASLGWELDLWGRVRQLTETAQAQLAISEFDTAAARLVLSADVASAYLQLRALDEESCVVAAARDSRRDALRVVQARFDAGSTQELDLQRALAELALAEAEVLDLARRRDIAESALAVLTGRPPADLRVPATGAGLPRVPAVPVGLPSALLDRRPDLASARAALLATQAQIGVAEASMLPTLRLTGGFGFASSELGALLSAPARLFSIGPSVSVPWFDGGRNQANLDAARAANREATAQFRQRVLGALREVDDALGELQRRSEISAVQQRALDATDRALRVARLRYEQGAASYLEVTDADRTALTTRRALSQTQAARLQATVVLIKALGGGWEGTSQGAP